MSLVKASCLLLLDIPRESLQGFHIVTPALYVPLLLSLDHQQKGQ